MFFILMWKNIHQHDEIPSTWIVNSSSPDIFCLNRVSTRSITRSTLENVVRWLECGPEGSYEEGEGASCIWIDPIRLDESLGQNRG